MTTNDIPGWWQGTKPEWIVFYGLQSRGMVHNQDFMYSPYSEDGIAFRFMNPRDLAINITGLMQEYESGKGSASKDIVTKQQMLGLGIRLVFIEDVDLDQDANYYINEALEYRDHSHMGD